MRREMTCSYCRTRPKVAGTEECRNCKRAATRLAELVLIPEEDALAVIGQCLSKKKTDEFWVKSQAVLLERRGLCHSLVPGEDQRYLTRTEFPQVKEAFEIEYGQTVFVYGCGLGGFVRYLIGQGVDAWGIENNSLMAREHKNDRIIDANLWDGGLAKRKLIARAGFCVADVVVSEFVVDSFPFEDLNEFIWLLGGLGRACHVVREEEELSGGKTNQPISWWESMYPEFSWLGL